MWDIFMKLVVLIAGAGLISGMWYLRHDPMVMPQNRWDCYIVITLLLVGLLFNLLMAMYSHNTDF